MSYHDLLVNEDPDFGFNISCKKCGGIDIEFENSLLGYSAPSGSWGDASLTCRTCKNSTVLVGS